VKKNKYHLYLEETSVGKDGYYPTACGRKGCNVGGLLRYFFGMIKPKYRCKTCNKIYKKGNRI